MDDLNVIDQFVAIFSQYIDSGFGLLGEDVAFLTTALITIDITLAGLFWAMGPDTDIIAKFIKKVLYVGVFALIIGNFALLADVIFNSFAQLGLTATGGTITSEDILKPGFVAATGFEAAHPLLDEIEKLTGPVAFFRNIVIIGVLGLAWIITLLTFFFLAIQLFVTIIEFKLTTLAGFVLIPFALWNKTSFLAERVLGNVISSGIKLMVLAIILGIGSTVFGSITATFEPDAVTLEQASSVILGSLAMLMLGIFGPGIATGIVSGAPQLGAGAAIGTAAGAGAGAVAGASLAGATTRIAGGIGKSATHAAARIAGGGMSSFSLAKAASGQTGIRGMASGVSGMAKAGAGSVKQGTLSRLSATKAGMSSHLEAGARTAFTATGGTGVSAIPISGAPSAGQPNWARKIQTSQTRRDASLAAAAAVRDGDRPGSGASPKFRDGEEQ